MGIDTQQAVIAFWEAGVSIEEINFLLRLTGISETAEDILRRNNLP